MINLFHKIWVLNEYFKLERARREFSETLKYSIFGALMTILCLLVSPHNLFVIIGSVIFMAVNLGFALSHATTIHFMSQLGFVVELDKVE